MANFSLNFFKKSGSAATSNRTSYLNVTLGRFCFFNPVVYLEDTDEDRAVCVSVNTVEK